MDSVRPLVNAKSFRAIAFLLAFSLIVAAPAAGDSTRDAEDSSTNLRVRSPRSRTSAVPAPRYSDPPTDRELFTSGFPEPLAPLAATTPEGNRELAAALEAHSQSTNPDDVTALTAFIERHPRSPWNTALLVNLGLTYRRTGNFSKALDAWRRAWDLSRNTTDPKARALADRAVGELAVFLAYLGRHEELEPLLAEIRERPMRGPATELIANASAGLALMHERPEVAFLCGPMALERIATMTDPASEAHPVLEAARSTPQGLSLTQVRDVSREAGMNFQMARRLPGAELVVPAVAHWKLGHFAAISRKVGDRYLIQDPTFGEDLLVSPATLDREASGYFLIPPGPLPDGWQVVSAEQGNEVWGRGNTGSNEPGGTSPDDVTSNPDCDDAGGMTRYNFHAMLVGLTLRDTPVGYTPPLGPPVRFEMFYSQRDSMQPANFSYSNFGPKWTSNWISYVTDNTATNNTASLYGRGGGLETYSFPPGSSLSNFGPFSQARLTKLTLGGMTTGFVRELRDGSTETFEQIFGNQFFLTEVADPTGNAVTLTYDLSMRLVSLTDALGKVTVISYDDLLNPLRITSVTDPFGRSATFAYNASGRLESITDTIGLVSSYLYGPGDFVNTLTTPYGTTTFTFGDSSTDPGLGTRRFITATDPLGQTERTEFRHAAPGISSSDPLNTIPSGMNTKNQFLQYRNTFVWSKHALPLASAGGTLDYTKARRLHWLHTTNTNVTSRILESTKEPFENRVWFNYAGQSSGSTHIVGTSSRPTKVGRVLDNGSTQLWQFQYNGFGKVTQATDPVGRKRSFTYAANGIDLLSVKNTTGGKNEQLFAASYNSFHQPITVTDVANQTTMLSYDGNGRLESVTNPLNENTIFTYTDSLLTSINRPLGWASTFTYDTFDRVRTATDPLGYTLTFDYDAADRLTKTTYPDLTTEERTYRFLDLETVTDRLGRTTGFVHDANRQLEEITDPLGRVTEFAYCECGAVSAVTDGAGNTTTFEYDVQDRLVEKRFADDTSIVIAYENTTSRIRWRTDPLGQSTVYSYNADDTLHTITYANALNPTPWVSFSWDGDFERILSMTDGTGTTQFGYHPVGVLGATLLSSSDGPGSGDSINLNYDALGRLVWRGVGGGYGLSRQFDALGRVSRTWNPKADFTLSYLGASGLVSQVASSDVVRDFTYFDNLGDRRLQTISNSVPGGPVLSEFDYIYNAVGRVTQRSEAVTGIVGDLSYDTADQLLGVTLQNSIPSTFSYTYDFGGNRTSETIDGQTSSLMYNSLNEISSSGYVYDANGNITDRFDTTPGWHFHWDAADRLIEVDRGGDRTLFEYDGFGRRTRVTHKEDGQVTSDRRYVWCGLEICLAQDLRDNHRTVRVYYSGLGEEEKGSGGGQNDEFFTYTTDALGNVRELVDRFGDVRASYEYEPYGRRTKTGGDKDADFGFAGLFHHEPSGLDLAVFRAYDSNLGRWLNRDPLGEVGRPSLRGSFGDMTSLARVANRDTTHFQGTNLYGYVLNDPVNAMDPLGLQFEPLIPLACYGTGVVVTGTVCPAACGLTGNPVLGGICLGVCVGTGTYHTARFCPPLFPFDEPSEPDPPSAASASCTEEAQ